MTKGSLCCCVALALMLLSSGCGAGGSGPVDGPSPTAPGPTRDPTAVVLQPGTPGEATYGNDLADIDASNTAEGYVCARTLTPGKKIKALLTREGDATYTYNLPSDGSYAVLPLTCGDGVYTLNIYHNLTGDQYVQDLSAQFEVALRDPLLPFLYPNQYVDFTADSAIVARSQELATGAGGDLDVIGRIYDAVITGVAYDYEKLEGLPSSYLPDVDETLASGKGICFDYAALMTAMLRAQRIPTRLIIGYSGDVYHAWISVYTPETGWIHRIIEFDGHSWVRMDPTFASASNSSQDILRYIGDGSHYNDLYVY